MEDDVLGDHITQGRELLAGKGYASDTQRRDASRKEMTGGNEREK